MSHYSRFLRVRPVAYLTLAVLVTIPPHNAFAHAIVGDRIFPQTFTIDDPDVLSGLTLPQVNITKNANGGTGATGWGADIGAEFDVRLTQNLGVSIGGGYTVQDSNLGEDGLDNFELGAKYVLYRDAPSESIFSIGLDWELGNTGNVNAGVATYSTVTPEAFFGKGFGELPDSMDYVRPFALTGEIGLAMPTSYNNADGSSNPDQLTYGLALEYSLPYLQQHVEDMGLGKFWGRMTPLVEFDFSSPVDRLDGSDNETTGTVNPGVIWIGDYSQVGVEAIIPINTASGRAVGAIVGAELYLDDILPKTFGTPLFDQFNHAQR